MRELIKLACTGCSGKNSYFQTKNKKLKAEKLITKKYCKFCKKRTDHKETKV